MENNLFGLLLNVHRVNETHCLRDRVAGKTFARCDTSDLLHVDVFRVRVANDDDIMFKCSMFSWSISVVVVDDRSIRRVL